MRAQWTTWEGFGPQLELCCFVVGTLKNDRFLVPLLDVPWPGSCGSGGSCGSWSGGSDCWKIAPDFFFCRCSFQGCKFFRVASADLVCWGPFRGGVRGNGLGLLHGTRAKGADTSPPVFLAAGSADGAVAGPQAPRRDRRTACRVPTNGHPWPGSGRGLSPRRDLESGIPQHKRPARPTLGSGAGIGARSTQHGCG